MMHWQIWAGFGALAALGVILIYLARRCPEAFEDDGDGGGFVAFF